MSVFHILAILVISSGIFFLLVGSIGLIRLPDFYARSHATGKADTLGIMLVIIGLIIFEGFSLNSAKMLIILSFVALTNPTATHALARAAFKFGVKPRCVEKKAKKRGS
jgi:multicomponent Na+:H+ antiporter subunit G